MGLRCTISLLLGFLVWKIENFLINKTPTSFSFNEIILRLFQQQQNFGLPLTIQQGDCMCLCGVIFQLLFSISAC